jgi:hypothetical protein
MVFHTVHLLGGDFVREDVCSAIDFEGIPIDDLTLESFGKVDAQS